jgi:hypothetical protein
MPSPYYSSSQKMTVAPLLGREDATAHKAPHTPTVLYIWFGTLILDDKAVQSHAY